MDFKNIGFWERFLEAVFWNFLRAPYNKAFVRLLGLKGDERVLEFGSGSGAISRHLAPFLSYGGELICLDTSKGLMDIAKRRLGRHSNVRFVEGELRPRLFTARSFDAVVVHFVLHDVPVPDRAPLIREMARLLKKRGRLILREPTRPGHGITPQEVRALTADAGLNETTFSLGRRMAWIPYFSATYTR